jgi:hypothetical protein
MFNYQLSVNDESSKEKVRVTKCKIWTLTFPSVFLELKCTILIRTYISILTLIIIKFFFYFRTQKISLDTYISVKFFK